MDARDMARLANNIIVFMRSTLKFCIPSKRHAKEYFFYRVIHILSFTRSNYSSDHRHIVNKRSEAKMAMG